MKRLLAALLFASGFAYGMEPGKLSLYQEKAVLGEPIVVGILSPPQSDWGLPYWIEIAGPERTCIKLADFTMKPLQGRRLDLSHAFKKEGKYVISIFYDWSNSCLDSEESVREKKRQDPNLFKPFEKHEIIVNYPVDFDKALWENNFSSMNQSPSLWGPQDQRSEKDKALLDEILRHPESDYFPWAVYAAFNYRGILAPMVNMIPPANADLPPENMRQNRQTEKLLQNLKLLDEVDKRWKGFPFLDELMIPGAVMAHANGDLKKAIDKIQWVIQHTKDDGLQKQAAEFLKKLKDKKTEKEKQKK